MKFTLRAGEAGETGKIGEAGKAELKMKKSK